MITAQVCIHPIHPDKSFAQLRPSQWMEQNTQQWRMWALVLILQSPSSFVDRLFGASGFFGFLVLFMQRRYLNIPFIIWEYDDWCRGCLYKGHLCYRRKLLFQEVSGFYVQYNFEEAVVPSILLLNRRGLLHVPFWWVWNIILGDLGGLNKWQSSWFLWGLREHIANPVFAMKKTSIIRLYEGQFHEMEFTVNGIVDVFISKLVGSLPPIWKT